MCESKFYKDSSHRWSAEQFAKMSETIGLSLSSENSIPASRKTDYTNVTDLLALLDNTCQTYCQANSNDVIQKYLRNAANSAYFDRRTAKAELKAVKKIMSNDLFLFVVQVCKVKRRALDYEEFVKEQYPQLNNEERKLIGNFEKI